MITVLDILGIYEGDIEHAWEMCEDKLESLHIDGDKMEEVQDYLENSKSEWDLDDITNSIISQILDRTTEIIEDEYPNISVDTYVNGWDTHISTSYDKYIDMLDGEEDATVQMFFKNDVADSSLLSETELKEIIEAGYLEDLVNVFENGNDLTFYDSVEELGEDEEDNGCRDEDDTDEDFGEFLIQAFKDGNSSTFYYEFSSGKVIAGEME